MTRNKWFSVIVSMLLIQSFSSQQLNNSPYTRYGLGEITGKNTTAPFSMGGLSTPLSDARYLNVANPASYSSLLKNNPIIDISLAGKFSNLKTESENANFSNFGLRNFILGIPISKQWGLAIGLMPYSTSGYSITDYSLLDGDTVRNLYEGDGSLNRVFFGNGVDLINRGDTLKFSVGVNASYIFGTLDRQRNVIFDNTTFSNSKVKNRNVVNGFTFDGGMHFFQKVNKDFSWQFGATYTFGNDLKGSQNFYAYSFKYDHGIIEREKDTLSYYEDLEGTISIPRMVSSGLAVTYKSWTVGFQYDIENWQQYKEVFDGVETTEFALNQSDKMIVGFEYNPKTDYNNKNKNVFQKSIYRFGFNSGNTAIELDSVQLKNYGISFGASIPLLSSRSLSMINIGVELGKMGTIDNGLILDNYLKLSLGFSLSPSSHDRWFRKRKYD